MRRDVVLGVVLIFVAVVLLEGHSDRDCDNSDAEKTLNSKQQRHAIVNFPLLFWGYSYMGNGKEKWS